MASQLFAGDSAAATVKRIKQAVETARKCTPCVLFFNHVSDDARGIDSSESSDACLGELPVQAHRCGE